MSIDIFVNVIINLMNKKIVKNSVLLVGGQIVGRTIGFLYFIFLARQLSVENFGIYAWVLGFIYNFLPIADFGLQRYTLKHIPRQPQKTNYYFRHLLTFKVILGVFTTILAICSGLLLGLKGTKLISLLIFSSVFLLHNIFHIIVFFQNAQERVLTGIVANIAFSSLGAILGVLAIQLKLSVVWLFIAYLSALSIAVLGLIIKAKKVNLPFKLAFDIDFTKKVFSECWVFAVLVIMANFYLRIPLMITGWLLGDYWSGIYGSVSKFIEAGVLIPQAILIAAAPTFSRLLITNKKKLKKIYAKLNLTVFLLALPVAFIFNFSGKIFIGLVYGEKYFSAVPTLRILGLLMPILFINWLAGNIIENSTRLKKFIPWAAGKFLFVFILSLILIKQMGIIGGGWALLAGEFLGLMINLVFVGKILAVSNSRDK